MIATIIGTEAETLQRDVAARRGTVFVRSSEVNLKQFETYKLFPANIKTSEL
jgi:hypothetical protein